MRRLLLILIVLGFLAGSGVGGWYVFQSVMIGDETSPAVAAVPRQAPETVTFVDLQPIMVTLLGNDRPQQFVTLQLVLEVRNASDAARVAQQQQRLSNALVESLYSLLGSPEIVTGAVIDLRRLRSRIQTICNRVLGDEVVRQVLIQGITQRQL